jgi:hypothetical protein
MLEFSLGRNHAWEINGDLCSYRGKVLVYPHQFTLDLLQKGRVIWPGR